MSRLHALLLSAALTAGVVSPVAAGTFIMQSVWDVTESSPYGDSTLVMIGAEAIYEGFPDPSDDDWAIQTNLEHLGQTVYGTPASGGGVPTTGMKIQVDARQHGAFKDIPNCTLDGNSHQYRGRGVVAIYHQSGPEISTLESGWRLTDCQPSGGGGTSTDPDGGAEDPPQTGTGGMCDHQEPCTPILVDLDRGHFQLTSPAGGVLFDLNRDGEKELLSWTRLHSGDAWLALDRNGNGRIDDGGELFGNFTDQPASEQPQGYSALAVFDVDGDSRISRADPVYSSLLLWSDRNHDGISQSDELMTLTRAEIEWLSLDPTESRSRDRHGNEFRYRALVKRQSDSTVSTDVFLVSEP